MFPLSDASATQVVIDTLGAVEEAARDSFAALTTVEPINSFVGRGRGLLRIF